MKRQLSSSSRALNQAAASDTPPPSKRKLQASGSEDSIVAISPPRIVNRATKKAKRTPTAELATSRAKSTARKQILTQAKLSFGKKDATGASWHEDLREELRKREVKPARKQTTLPSFFGGATSRSASAAPAPATQPTRTEHDDKTLIDAGRGDEAKVSDAPSIRGDDELGIGAASDMTEKARESQPARIELSEESLQLETRIDTQQASIDEAAHDSHAGRVAFVLRSGDEDEDGEEPNSDAAGKEQLSEEKDAGNRTRRISTVIEQAEGTSSQQDDSHRANKKLKVVHAEQEASSPAIVSSSSTDCQSEKLQLGELAVKQTPETEGATHPAKPTKLTGWRAVAARQALEGSGTCRTSDFAQFELVLAFLKEQKEEALRELYSTGRGDYDLIKKRMDAEAKMFLEDQAQRTEKAQQLWARADWERMRAEGKQDIKHDGAAWLSDKVAGKRPLLGSVASMRMHEQGGLLSEAEVEDLLSDTSLFEMPDNEVARQLHLLVTIPWASDEKLSREPGPASGSVWVRQVEALRRVRAYGFEEDERSAPRPEAKIIDLTELDEADGNESELSDLTELDEDEVELPKIAAAPESVVESSDDEEQVPQRRKRTSAKAYIESSDSSEKDDDGDVKKQVAVKSKKKIGKARSQRKNVAESDDEIDADDELAFLREVYASHAEAPVTHAQWSAFRREHRDEVMAVADKATVIDELRASFRELQDLDVFHSDHQHPSSVFDSIKIDSQNKVNCLEPLSTARPGFQLARALVENAVDELSVSVGQGILDMLRKISGLRAAGRSLADGLEATKAAQQPLRNALADVAPAIAPTKIEYPTGVMCAPTAVFLHYPPAPPSEQVAAGAANELMSSRCETVKLLRAQGWTVGQSTYMADVLPTARPIPPDALNAYPGHRALFDVNAADERQAVQTLCADELMYRWFEETVRLRAVSGGTLNVASGTIAWETAKNVLSALDGKRLSDGRYAYSDHVFACYHHHGVEIEFEYVVVRSSQDGRARKARVESVWIGVVHPSSFFYNQSIPKAILIDASMALLHLVAGTTATALPAGASTVYQDLVANFDSKGINLIPNSTVVELRDLRIAEKKAHRAVTNIPPKILAIYPAAARLATKKHGEYTGNHGKTILYLINQYLFQKRQDVIKRVFGYEYTKAAHMARYQASLAPEKKADNLARRMAGSAAFRAKQTTEERKSQHDKLMAGQKKWAAKDVPGKGNQRMIMLIDAKEKNGKLSTRSVAGGPVARDRIKYLGVQALRKRVNTFLREGYCKVLGVTRKHSTEPAIHLPQGAHARLTASGVEVAGWPAGHAIGVGQMILSSTTGEKAPSALYECAQIWQMIKDGDIVLRRIRDGSRFGGKVLFSYENMKSFRGPEDAEEDR